MRIVETFDNWLERYRKTVYLKYNSINRDEYMSAYLEQERLEHEYETKIKPILRRCERSVENVD